MNRWMVVGGIMAAVAVAGLLYLSIGSIKRKIEIALFEGGDLGKALRKGFTGLLIVGGCLFAAAFIRTHLPRGLDSLLSQNEEGASVGDDKAEVQEGEGRSDETDVSVESMNVYTIVVEGKRIYFDGQYFDDLQEFATHLDTIVGTDSIRIEDDYAVAAAFRHVEEILDEREIDYVLYDELEGTE
ncbi:MAG: hypothetical protein NC416_17190 [Eubacterium sp.]|nr:hypothetical protein [Eubacterium sp.]